MIELERGVSREIEPRPERELLIVGHTYQPPRKILMPTTNTRIEAAPQINEQIYRECYEPLFVRGEIPQGVFSLYPTLREWIRTNHPDSYDALRQKIKNLKDKEYKVLGDPYIHVILPLLPEEDQDTLLKIGRSVFLEDFGFEPKGLWLPETAVSKKTLGIAKKNGYEFVVLRDYQLEEVRDNPMHVETDEGDIAVLHLTSDLSGSVSFDDHFTTDGEQFLKKLENMGRRTLAIGTDTEFYGHHGKGKDAFLKYITDPGNLKCHGIANFDVKARILDPDKKYTAVRERTSWSCEHNLGRWTGESSCNCGSPSEERLNEKKWLSVTLGNYANELNNLLNQQDPKWRERFIPFFTSIKDAMFNGQSLSGKEDPLFLAKVCQLIGMTSCAWFFDKVGGAETQIAHGMNAVIPRLIDSAYSF